MKRRASALIIILVSSFFVAGSWQFVNFAEANMYPYPIRFVRVGEASRPAGTKPIPVLISSTFLLLSTQAFQNITARYIILQAGIRQKPTLN
jgi:hypothetical protein